MLLKCYFKRNHLKIAQSLDLNQKKNEIQLKALASHHAAGGYSTLSMCTGSGKSRCAVLRALEIVSQKPDARIFLAVPTEKLRDQNWKAEFQEWGGTGIFEKNLTRACYVSVHKYLNQEWDLVILDEAHHVTEATLPFFTENNILSIIALTATFPKDKIKKGILNAIAPISFDYPIEQGLADGVVAPFTIDVIFTTLDDIFNCIDAGPKAKRFKTTELKSYQFWDTAFNDNKEKLKVVKDSLYAFGWNEQTYEALSKLKDKSQAENYIKSLVNTPIELKEIKSTLGKYAGLMGSRFRIIGSRKAILQNALNKERIGKRFINEIFQDDMRYLVFCGSIAQSERLLPGMTFHSQTTDHAYNAFLNEELNILAVKDKVNEGTNIPNLDQALALHVSAQELILIQRIGRVIRVRDGHTGKIYLVCVKGTQDEVWLQSALKAFKNVKIDYWSEKDFFDYIESLKLAA